MPKSLSSVPSGYVVPIEVDAEYSSSKIFIMLLVIGALLALIFFIYYRNQVKSRKTDEQLLKEGSVALTLNNITSSRHNIDIPGMTSFVIEPHQTANITVPYGSVIHDSSFLSTGEILKDTFKADLDDIKGTIYITPSGIKSAKNLSMGVRLTNMANYPVLFVERSHDGKRMWGSNIIPPHSYDVRDYVSGGSVWHAYHPTDEDHPIASTITGLKNTQLVFDGRSLISE